MAEPDGLKLLAEDHRRVERLFEELESTKGANDAARPATIRHEGV